MLKDTLASLISDVTIRNGQEVEPRRFGEGVLQGKAAKPALRATGLVILTHI